MRLLKSLAKGWNPFELVLLFLGLTVPTAIGIAFESGLLEILSSTLSIVMTLLVAKGKLEGYFLCLVSMAFYLVVCLNNAVYGEVILMLVFQYPIIIWGIRSWLKNKRIDIQKGQVVVVTKVGGKEIAIVIVSQAVMAIGYYFLLKVLDTEQLVVSTILFAWSIVATYLFMRRSHINLVAYFINDIIAVVLWALVIASGTTSAAAVLVMPAMYLINDGYGIFMWRKLMTNQTKIKESEAAKDAN